MRRAGRTRCWLETDKMSPRNAHSNIAAQRHEWHASANFWREITGVAARCPAYPPRVAWATASSSRREGAIGMKRTFRRTFAARSLCLRQGGRAAPSTYVWRLSRRSLRSPPRMAGAGKLLAAKSRRGPQFLPHIGLAPLTAMLEGGELRALSGGVRALGSIPSSGALSPPALTATRLEGRAANSLALKRIPICADWRRHA